ncbi:MAG: hypothetical protein M3R36_13650 [Bacteroidota bacterium]|nr:hypothetical protein [Bacteroidota bacterium]
MSKTKNHNILKEDLLKNIEEVLIKRGKQPSHKQMTTPLSKFWATTYVRRFGSWQNALNEFIKFVSEASSTLSQAKKKF